MFCFNGCQIVKYLIYGNADNALNKKSNDYQIKQLIDTSKRHYLLKMPQQTEVNYIALLFDLPQYRDNDSLISKFIPRFSEIREVSLYALAVVLRTLTWFFSLSPFFLAVVYC